MKTKRFVDSEHIKLTKELYFFVSFQKNQIFIYTMSGSDYSSWKVADLKAALKSKVRLSLIESVDEVCCFCGCLLPRTCDARA